ncbi:MAG: 3-phosphoshikimate 1-carboxyvinyltransferase [Oscillospiraceae bacterium]|nr:3-phosphoshikimate 1-carboxyvinyltransferase [Oscillospiraceae bacterium]
MNITISPAPLRGTITPPPSKSQAHRLIILASLANGESTITNFDPCEDLLATVRAMRTLGAQIEADVNTLHIRGIASRVVPSAQLPQIDCGDSGSTLRFLIPVALAVAGGGIFTGSKRLMERPLAPYFDIFREQGIYFSLENDTLTVRGHLQPGEYRLPGNVSSQFFSGLLLALPLLDEPSRIVPEGQLESSSYVTMTLHALSLFGVHLPATMSLPPQYHIPSNSVYQPQTLCVEADWSQAAFWYAAAGIGNHVAVTGMNKESFQGDRAILDHGALLSRPGNVSIDISDCPDLAPPLAVWGALREGQLRLTNAARLRLKESDRLAAITDTLTALGADIHTESDTLMIVGKPSLAGGVTVDCRSDHRIAMMLAIAATRCEQPITLTGTQCVSKSYPNFWADFTALGGVIHEHAGQ